MPINTHTTWMADKFEELKDRKISDLTLLGTHDSGAHQVDFSKKLKKGFFPNLLRNIFRFTPISWLVKRWTKTQDMTITEQLQAGVRAFDLRGSYNEDEKRFYLSHTFACMPLDDALKEIDDFMQNNPKEIIVIKMKPDSANEGSMKDHEQELFTLLQSKLTSLCPCKTSYDHPDLTIGNMVKQNHRSILFFDADDNESLQYPATIWPFKNKTKGTWLNAANEEEWDEKFSRERSNICQDRSMCNSFDMVFTPDTNSIVKGFWKSIKHSLKTVKTKIINLFNDTDIRPNIVYTDFPDHEIINTVIEHSQEAGSKDQTNALESSSDLTNSTNSPRNNNAPSTKASLRFTNALNSSKQLPTKKNIAKDNSPKSP